MIKCKLLKGRKGLSFAACIMAAAMLVGCGGSSDKMSYSFDGESYSANDTFEDFVASAVGNDNYIMDAYYCKFYNEDGTYSDMKAFGQEANEIDRSKLILVNRLGRQDKIGYQLYFDAKFESLNNYKSADGVIDDTEAEDLPEQFVDLGTYSWSWWSNKNEVTNDYFAVLKDGEYVNLQDYIDNLPEEATDEFAEQIADAVQEAINDCHVDMYPEEMRVESIAFKPSIVIDNYEDENYRKVCAIVLAIDDLHNEYEAGEIESFGAISYAYVEDEMVSCLYSVINE